MADEEALRPASQQAYQSPEWESSRKRSSLTDWLRSSKPLGAAGGASKEPPIKESSREPSIDLGTSTNVEAGVAPTTGKSSFIDAYFPPDKRYLGLSRNYFLLFVLTPALLIILIALAVGLGVGLSDRNRGQNLPFPSSDKGPWEGDITYYEPGIGACGKVSKSNEMIVAVSHKLWDAQQEGSNPNTNSLCGKKVRVRRDFVEEGKGPQSVDLTVVDRCTGCEPTDLDMSITAFKKLAREVDGRVLATWTWLN